jgi:hypothetical protein
MEINNFGQQVQELAKSDDKKANGPFGQTVSELAHAKNAEKAELSSQEQLNISIVQATIDVSVSSGNEPLSLLLKSAIEGINDALQATHGDNAIQAAYDSGLDVSPEATADRIVSLSTAFFSSYQEQHPELSQEEALIKFVDVISGGIDQGFAEAREILDGLQVLEGDIASDIDKTYELVQSGLTSFLENGNNS